MWDVATCISVANVCVGERGMRELLFSFFWGATQSGAWGVGARRERAALVMDRLARSRHKLI